LPNEQPVVEVEQRRVGHQHWQSQCHNDIVVALALPV